MEILYRNGWKLTVEEDASLKETEITIKCREKNEKINKLADIIEAVLSQGNICVVGNAGKIEECKTLFMETKDLLK